MNGRALCRRKNEISRPLSLQDRNFDDIAEKFARNIYGTTKGKIRQAVVWQDLTRLLAQLPQRPLRILDAGGGKAIWPANWQN